MKWLEKYAPARDWDMDQSANARQQLRKLIEGPHGAATLRALGMNVGDFYTTEEHARKTLRWKTDEFIDGWRDIVRAAHRAQRGH